MFKIDNNEIVGDNDSRTNKTVVNLFKNNKSKNLIYMPNIEAMMELIFLIFNAKKIFNFLKLVFIKTPIFWHFDSESHIKIKKDALGYTIGKILGQLNQNFNTLLNDLYKSDFS